MTDIVNQLTAKNIRGIREIRLPLEANLLVLGENGCGKSSIVDAIEYYFTGRVEKLSGRQDVRENLSLQFAGGGPLSVAFRFSKSDNDYEVSFPYSKPDVPDNLGPFYKAAAERPFILRRSQLLHFIDARPSDRYELVSNLIGLDDLNNIEAAWKDKATEVSRNLKSVKQELSTTNTQLTTLLNIEIQTESQIILGINSKLAEHDIEPIAKYSDLVSRKTSAHNKSVNPENVRKAEQIRQIKRKVDEILAKLEEIITTYSQLFDAWQIFLSNAETVNDAIFEKLLIEGLQIVSQNPIEICPICEEPIKNRTDLICRLRERGEALRTFTESRKAMEKQENIILQTFAEFSRLVKNLEAELSSLEFEEKFYSPDGYLKSKFNPWMQNLVRKPLSLLHPQEFQKAIVLQETKSILLNISDISNRQIDLLTPSDQESRILKLVDLLGQVDALWQSWIKASKQKELAEKIDKQLDTLYKELIAAKKRGLDQILSDLDKIFNNLYGQIHPDEGYKKISLILPPNRASSIGLEAQKDGTESMHPLGIFSEGHLDSLGLCIFLAFIKRFNGDFNIIVLDDILTSIDAGHRMRVAKLIASEFKDYRIILTTHDEFWANELSTVFSNNGLALKMIRMNPWNKNDGATYDDYISTDWQYYINEVAKARKQDAIAGVGRNLERFLFTMRRNLRIAIPATYDDRYTIGDLYEPFFTWIDRHPIYRPDMLDHAQRLSVLKDELDDYWRFRNWSGAHYNEWGASVSQPEALTFVKLIQELVSYFQCPACSTLVLYDPSKKVVHCPNCKPSPSTKVVWVYKPDWRQRAERLKTAQRVLNKEINLVKMAQSAIENYLKDLRRKLGLPIQATANDEYGLAEVYDVFVDFVKTNPRSGGVDFPEKITTVTEMLAEFITSDRRWIDARDVQNKYENLLSAAMQLTELLECSSCGDLVHFDYKEQIYYCTKCDKKEAVEPPGAHWFTE